MEEADLVADRVHLRKLLHEHPDWPRQEYADQIGRSPPLGQEMDETAAGGCAY